MFKQYNIFVQSCLKNSCANSILSLSTVRILGKVVNTQVGVHSCTIDTDCMTSDELMMVMLAVRVNNGQSYSLTMASPFNSISSNHLIRQNSTLSLLKQFSSNAYCFDPCKEKEKIKYDCMNLLHENSIPTGTPGR